jgi:hypothetical protein
VHNIALLFVKILKNLILTKNRAFNCTLSRNLIMIGNIFVLKVQLNALLGISGKVFHKIINL